MKKTLAIVAIVLCVLSTSMVFATSTQEAIDSLSATTQDTMDILTGGKSTENSENINNNQNIKDNQTENNVKQETKNENKQVVENNNNKSSVSKITEIKDKEKKSIEDYQKAYGSDSYGFTAYILSRIQIYSIPFCFLGIAISAIYQYVIGIRKMDTRDKGFAIMISIVTIFVIAQVLPLIFAIVVKGWRG